MPLATLISTQGPYLEALLDIEGVRFCVMDEFSVCADTAPKPGDVFEFRFSAELAGDESWETQFAGNPDQRIGLHPLNGWAYRAYGKVLSVSPVIVECGILQLEDVVCSNDPALIGEHLAFTITRLGGYPD